MIGLEFTSQKSFSCAGSQTLFSAEPVTEKIRLRLQAIYFHVTLLSSLAGEQSVLIIADLNMTCYIYNIL